MLKREKETELVPEVRELVRARILRDFKLLKA
jgi:hypothetical protein